MSQYSPDPIDQGALYDPTNIFDHLELNDPEFFDRPDDDDDDNRDGKDGEDDDEDNDDDDDSPSYKDEGNPMHLPIDTCFQDKFEDELIEHANESTKPEWPHHQTTYEDIPPCEEEPMQHSFQEIPRFGYEYADKDSLAIELEEWFVYDDNAIFGDTKLAFLESSDHRPWKDLNDQDKLKYIQNCLNQLKVDSRSLDNFDGPNKPLYCLNYLIQGTFGEITSTLHQISIIKQNCHLIWKSGVLPVVYDIMRKIIDKFLPEDLSTLWTPNNDDNPDDCGSELGLALFQSATILYFLIEILGENPDFQRDLDNLNPPLLSFLVESIARIRWTGLRWNIPVRQMILLSWKFMLSQFGGRSRQSLAKKYMRNIYNLDPDHEDGDDDKEKDSNTSPLDYHAFRDDITSRYPSYTPPKTSLPSQFENNISSISHFIQIPRPLNAQAANSVLPPPKVHIATPVERGDMMPMYVPGQKPKKSAFHTNQSFPFIYPTTPRTNSDKGSPLINHPGDTYNSGDIEKGAPRSVVEAAELFASRVKVKVSLKQLWDERDLFMKQERGWVGLGSTESGEAKLDSYKSRSDKSDKQTNSESTPEGSADSLKKLETFYKASLPHFNSFITVILKVILASISFPVTDASASNININEIGHLRAKEITLKSASGLLDLLVRWLKISHVAKFEYISSLLFDSRYYLVVYKYFYSHDALEMVLQKTDIPEFGFFSQTLALSDHVGISESSDISNFIDTEPYISPTEAHYTTLITSHYSKRYFFSTINLATILRKILKKKTQRIIVVAELPSDTLRRALTIYQRQTWAAVLSIFKEQVPFNGKKWKHNNMKLISAIYLNCKLKLRDDWLVGSSVTSEVDDAYAQEIALRALVQFYNCRRYRGEMERIGYVINDIDFFKQEIESLMADGE